MLAGRSIHVNFISPPCSSPLVHLPLFPPSLPSPFFSVLLLPTSSTPAAVSFLPPFPFPSPFLLPLLPPFLLPSLFPSSLSISPPSFLLPSQGVSGRIPGNAVLIFEVEVKKIKLSKEREAEAEQDSQRPETPPPADTTRERSGSVKKRTQSIEEHMTHSQDGEGGASQRSNILSRISKMGQSMLPAGASPGSASVVSEDDFVSGGVIVDLLKSSRPSQKN